MGNKVIEKIFSVKNDGNGKHKVITVLGLKLKLKRLYVKSETEVSSSKIKEYIYGILSTNQLIKLHLGCGDVYKKGWVNIDGVSYGDNVKIDLIYDLRNPLPFPDNSVDYIFNEHFLEHLSVEESRKSLKDFMRVLKPNGVMRIAMPDLDIIMKAYFNTEWKKEGEDFFKKFDLSFIETKAELVNINFRWWGHQWLYDWEELERRLKEVGCTNIKKCELRESEHLELKNLENRDESILIAEVIKI